MPSSAITALRLTRTVTFHARHHLWRNDWSDAENHDRYGATATAHGHLYRVEVTVSGPRDPATGMIVDLSVLDAVIAQQVTEPLSGRHLNQAIDAFVTGTELVTCEALAAWAYNQIAPRLPAPVLLDRVRVAEDETLWADCCLIAESET